MFEKKKIKLELEEINARLENQENWQNHNLLNKDLKRKNYLVNFINLIEGNSKYLKDTIELLEISSESNDLDLINDLNQELKKIEGILSKLYLETLMSGKADANNSLIEIH